MENHTISPTALPLKTLKSLPLIPVATVISLTAAAVIVVCPLLLGIIIVVAYHYKKARKRKIATSATSFGTTLSSEDQHTAMLEQACGVPTPDAVTESKVHGMDPSVTSSVQLKHKGFRRLLRDDTSIASLDEPNVECEHIMCMGHNHDNDHNHVPSKTESGHHSYAVKKNCDRGGSTKVETENRVSENQGKAGLVAEKGNVIDTSNINNTQGVLSPKGYSSSNTVAKKISYGITDRVCHDLVKRGDSTIAKGQDSPIIIETIFEDWERSKLVSTRHGMDTTIQDLGVSAEGVDPNIVAKRRPRGMTDDESHGDNRYKGQDSPFRIIQVFSDDRGRGRELNSLTQNSASCTTDRFKDEAHGMSTQSTMFEKRPCSVLKDQVRSDMTLESSISKGHAVGSPTTAGFGISRSEILPDGHSGRARSMTEVSPPLEAGNEIHSIFESQIGHSETKLPAMSHPSHNSESKLPAMSRLDKDGLHAWTNYKTKSS